MQNGQLNNTKELDMGFEEGGLFWMAGKALEVRASGKLTGKLLTPG